VKPAGSGSGPDPAVSLHAGAASTPQSSAACTALSLIYFGLLKVT
jgi:hypothetical protein